MPDRSEFESAQSPTPSSEPSFAASTGNDVLRYALRLFGLGYIPLRLPPESKAANQPGWQTEHPTEESLRRAFKFRSNIGVRTGDVHADGTCLMAIDIDLESGELIHCVERALGERSIPVKQGKKGYTYIFRFAGEQKTTKIAWERDGEKRHAIDVLCRGAQTVIPPSIHPQTKLPYRWVVGTPLDRIDYRSLPVFGPSLLDEIKGFCKNPSDPIAALNDMEWRGEGGGGNTHDTCVAAVASMVARGWPDQDILERIERAKREACEAAGAPYNWPQAQRTIREWIESARKKEFGTKQSKVKPSHGELANQVLAKHGAVIKRDKATLDWRVYNGKFWEENATEEVKTLIRQCLADHQVFRPTIDGVEAVMRLYPEVGVREDVWDRDRHYLNCPDATYDLKTREALPHTPAHLITKMARIAPRFDYQDSLWVKAIGTWFNNDPVEIEYIQTLFGMFLTGEVRDECVAMWVGKSGAGKSKMADIVSYVMGDYAQTATDTAFLEVRYHPHHEEIARMRGKRLVFIHEVQGHLNLRRLKSIASGESQAASMKGKDSFQFNPVAKLWFIGNEAPPTNSSGRELQRRMHVYEFMRQIDEKDMDVDLPVKLEAEAAFVLGWMIDGAVKYYRTGLVRSPHVVESTKRYFADADIIEQWIEDNCVVDRSAVTPVAELFDNFQPWAEDANVRHSPDKGRFSQRLKAKGFALERRTIVTGKPAARVIVGLQLRSLDDTPASLPRADNKF